MHFKSTSALFRSVLCALAASALLSAAPTSSPVPSPEPHQPCLISNNGPDVACASFATLTPRVLASFPPSTFAGGLAYDTRPLLALDDGSVLVAGGENGLFRIDARHEVTTLWRPTETDQHVADPIQLLAAFHGGAVVSIKTSILAVREDGSVTFRKELGANWNGPNALSDRDGTVWLQSADGAAAYAFFPRMNRLEAVPAALIPGKIIPGSDGRVFATSHDGVFAIESVPGFRCRLIHAPIVLPRDTFYRYGIDAYSRNLDVQAVGADGSLWGATLTQIIHIHPNGEIRALRLAKPIMWMSMPPQPFRLTLARDGSIWNSYNMIRVTNDDRIQKIDLPDHDTWIVGPSFAPDDTVWTDVTKGTEGDEIVVHLSISPR